MAPALRGMPIQDLQLLSEESQHIWPHVPGYDSDSDSEIGLAQEKNGRHNRDVKDITQRFEIITNFLADRWMEASLVPFAPVKLPKGTDKDGRIAKEPKTHHRRRSSMSALAQALRNHNGNGPAATFRLEHTSAPIVRETCLSNGLVPVPDFEFCLMWSGPGLKDHVYKDLHEFQRVNHFPGSTELTRKDCMSEHLNDMARVFGKDAFDFIPETFVLPDEVEKFLDAYRNQGGLWICKPHNSACGRGIFIFRHLHNANVNLTETAVISRYVENPLLIQGLKFDLRVYVIVTQFEPLRAYIYREGLARFASAPYSTDDHGLSDVFRHLTNYSINKSAPNFCENAEVGNDHYGHKWSLSALNKHLKCTGANVDLMWSRIMDLVVKTLLAVEPTIGQRVRKVVDHTGICFEVYGFDVLVDDMLKPWIVEVNLSPSMQAESPLDWQVKSSLLSDAFNLVGVCNPEQRLIRTSRARAQILQARTAHRKAAAERGSFLVTGQTPAGKLEQRRMSLRKLQLRPRCKPSIPNEPLVLDSLSEGQLKMLARSLQEFQRCQNFIRLYPTREACERYAPIANTRSRGWRSSADILASALFGPVPVISEKTAATRRSQTPPETMAVAPAPADGAAKGGSSGGAEVSEAGAPQVKAAEATAEQSSAPTPGRTATSQGPEPASGEPPPTSEGLSTAPAAEATTSPREAGLPSATTAEPEARAAEAVVGGERELPLGPQAVDRPRDAADAAEASEVEMVVEGRPAAADGEDSGDEAEIVISDPSQEDEGSAGRPPSSDAVRPGSAGSSTSSGSGGAGRPLSPGSPGSCTPEEPEAEQPRPLNALRALTAGDSSRLVLMEYFLRVGRACEALSGKERALLAQCSAFARLSMFSRQVRDLRSRWIESNSAAEAIDDSDLDAGGLVEEIAAECRVTVHSLANHVWAIGGPSRPGSPEVCPPSGAQLRKLDRRIRELGRRLPGEVLQLSIMRQALDLLPMFADADLERLLLAPQCVEEFASLPQLFSLNQDVVGRTGPEARALPRITPYSPLTEIVAFRLKTKEASNAIPATPTLPALTAQSQILAASLPGQPQGVQAHGPSQVIRDGADVLSRSASFTRGGSKGSWGAKRWPPPPPSMDRNPPRMRRQTSALAVNVGHAAAAEVMITSPGKSRDGGVAIRGGSGQLGHASVAALGSVVAASRGWDFV